MLKNIFSNKKLIIWFLIIGTYLVTRIILLLKFPLFTDEVYYQRLMMEGLKKGDLLFSFVDGKEPLFFWIMTPVSGGLNLGVEGARIISVLSGLGSLICIYLLSLHLFSRKVAFISIFIYSFSPFALIYNQLGINDGFLSFLLCLTLLLVVRKRILYAAVVFGLCLITKTVSQIYLPLFILGIIIFNSADKAKKILIFSIVSGAIYLLTSFLPGFGNIAAKNATFVSIPSLIEFINNSKMIFKDWLSIYIGIPGVLIVGVMSAWGIFKKNIKIIFVTSLVVVPVLIESFIAKIFFPRYLLFTLIPIIILEAKFAESMINKISGKIFIKVLIFLLLLQPVVSFFQLEVYPEKANLPGIERWQFFEGWPSGYGIENIFNALNSTNKKLIYVPSYGVGEFVRWKFLFNPNYQIKIFDDRYSKIDNEAVYVSNEPLSGITSSQTICRFQCKSKMYIYETNN